MAAVEAEAVRIEFQAARGVRVVIEEQRGPIVAEGAHIVEVAAAAVASRGKKNASPFRLTARELNDVANISLKIPIDSVMYGIRHFYEQYISRNISYQNAPSLIRIFASDHAQFGFASG